MVCAYKLPVRPWGRTLSNDIRSNIPERGGMVQRAASATSRLNRGAACVKTLRAICELCNLDHAR